MTRHGALEVVGTVHGTAHRGGSDQRMCSPRIRHSASRWCGSHHRRSPGARPTSSFGGPETVLRAAASPRLTLAGLPARQRFGHGSGLVGRPSSITSTSAAARPRRDAAQQRSSTCARCRPDHHAHRERLGFGRGPSRARRHRGSCDEARVHGAVPPAGHGSDCRWARLTDPVDSSVLRSGWGIYDCPHMASIHLSGAPGR